METYINLEFRGVYLFYCSPFAVFGFQQHGRHTVLCYVVVTGLAGGAEPSTDWWRVHWVVCAV